MAPGAGERAAAAANGATARAISSDGQSAAESALTSAEMHISWAAPASNSAPRRPGQPGRAGERLAPGELSACPLSMVIGSPRSASPENHEHRRPGFPAHLNTILDPRRESCQEQGRPATEPAPGHPRRHARSARDTASSWPLAGLWPCLPRSFSRARVSRAYRSARWASYVRYRFIQTPAPRAAGGGQLELVWCCAGAVRRQTVRRVCAVALPACTARAIGAPGPHRVTQAGGACQRLQSRKGFARVR